MWLVSAHLPICDRSTTLWIKSSIVAIKQLGGKHIFITGRNIAKGEELAKRYRDIFAVFNKHKDKISRATFWGLHDGISWKNNFPIIGRTDYPLIFDLAFSLISLCVITIIIPNICI